MTDVLLTEQVGEVRILTLNRPRSRNALSGDLVSALYRALVALDTDDTVRAAVLTGADPAFCAGVDLKEAARDGDRYFQRFHRGDPIAQAARVRKPLIGAINGATFTGGLELALGCDFLVASERAVFADTHARVGVMPGGGLTARLPQLVGPGWARRMSMTGEVVDAPLAARIGLVTELVPPGRLRARALELAAAAAEVPSRDMLGLKEIYAEGASAVFGGALAVEQRRSAAHATDFGELDRRRSAVTVRNREQLAPVPEPESR
jgi:enoyl-CoA hydratase/carnithine racemase